MISLVMPIDSAPSRRHAATFYENQESLVTTVAGFIRQGLVSGEPALVIATAEHREAIEIRLQIGFIDVAARKRAGDLVIVDAEELMGTFMIGGSPDPAAFERNVGAFMNQMQRGRARTSVRAYGEIVNVLWQAGSTEAAVKVEMLWNKLASSFDFSLLCGYAMGNFFKEAEGLADVCRLHTHVSHVASGGIDPVVH